MTAEIFTYLFPANLYATLSGWLDAIKRRLSDYFVRQKLLGRARAQLGLFTGEGSWIVDA